jgi:SAM-dependent MidA family methyltransferase
LNTDELFQNRPNGTARAYKNHELRNDIFAFPGKQDITCHLCWDQMIGILKKESFQNIALSSQESFLIHYAKKALQTNVEQGNLAQISAIKELIHPQYMGQKFQVLHGLRGQTGV